MEIKKEKKEKDVVVSEKDVDMYSTSRGVWLVKVPNYISKRWKKCDGDIEAGCIRITKYKYFFNIRPLFNLLTIISYFKLLCRSRGQKLNATLILSEAILELREKGKEKEEIPKEHGLPVSTIAVQTLGVLSQCTGTLT